MNNKFILASGSPRRSELLKFLLSDFTIQVSDICEDLKEGLSNSELVMDLAFQKAKDISLKNPNQYVLGFDTLVILEGTPLGKPKDKKEAFDMIKSLSGKSHIVMTGCAIVNDDYEDIFYSETEVTFDLMTDDEIYEYIETNEPMDKAGAYGIQGFGSKYVKSIKGDYYTVMGLPVNILYKKLRGL